MLQIQTISINQLFKRMYISNSSIRTYEIFSLLSRIKNFVISDCYFRFCEVLHKLYLFPSHAVLKSIFVRWSVQLDILKHSLIKLNSNWYFINASCTRNPLKISVTRQIPVWNWVTMKLCLFYSSVNVSDVITKLLTTPEIP